MRFSKQSYLIGSAVLISIVYIMYKYQTQPITAANVCTQDPLVHQKSPNLQGSFSAERRSAVHEQSFQPMVIPRERNASFDYKAAMQALNEAKVSHDDPRLIRLIRDYYIEPPSLEPYNLTKPERLDPSSGQAPFIDSRLNFMVHLVLYILQNH
ncbi:hypothetical protein DPMN_166752 [Dreissena polymorpha]|uniref:Uncharacterized protein n=1 Tax=Dreissena polymorpha TaxID=45954 RepID=A0A9D4F221_DREPO|nr:hypothetical protein DPMN_166752 [Dreissena polymorpha]